MKNFKFNKITIKIKLLTIFFILATVPISIVGTFSYFQAKKTISKLTIESAIKTIEQLSGEIRNIFSETETFLEIGRHESVKQILNNNKNNDIENNSVYELFKAYRNTYKYNKNIMDIYIIGKNRKVISERKGTYKLEQEEFESNPMYNIISKKPKEILVIQDYTSEYISFKNIGNIISFGTTIIDNKTDEIIGIVVVDFDTSIIEKVCNNYSMGKTGRFYILDKSNIIVSYPPKEFVEHVSDYRWNDIFKKKTGNTIQNLCGIDYLIVNDIPDNLVSGWKIFGEVPIEEIMKDAYKIKYLTISVVVICVFLSFGLFTFLTDKVTEPIRNLKKQMASVEKGNLEVRVTVPGHDELSDLGKSFNEMIKKIKLLLESSIKEQKKLKKLELNIMQAQINPHFLYNSLDAIVWMAEAQDKKKIIDMVTALSVFFRISLSKGAEFISIGREIEHCRNYLVIQKMRYGDLLSYTINIENDIINNKIIKIVLQPIVENAIYHGIKNKRIGGHIKIYGFRNDLNQIIFEIEDTGIGIKEDKLKILSEKLLEPDFNYHIEEDQSGFGLFNVNERIKLYFGNEYGISIESTYEIGTKIKIIIPVMG